MAKQIKNILINSIHDKALKNAVEQFINGRLIDIGCGAKPYKNLLAPFVTEHIGVDHQETLHEKSNIDRFGTVYNIPAKDEEFDCALCTAVLEHLAEPELALKECWRVLKRGGGWPYTQFPSYGTYMKSRRIFIVFSKYGLKYLFQKVGFEIIEIKALSGFWVTFGQLFVYNLYRFNRRPLKYIPIIPAIGLVIQGISYFFDKIDKTEQWTWMYMIVTRKPE